MSRSGVSYASLQDSEVKGFDWKIVDFRKKEDHKSHMLKIDGLRCSLYVETYKGKSSIETFWLFWLFAHDYSIYPLYYTMSVVQQNRVKVLTRKGVVVERTFNNQVLLGDLADSYIREANLIVNDTLSVYVTLELKYKGAELTLREPDMKLEILSSNFIDLYQSKTNTDCVLMIGDQEFPAHRAILSARSTVFSAMFLHDTIEKRSGKVTLRDVPASIFNDVLHYIYSGKIRGIRTFNATAIFTAADKYSLLELKTECLKFLKDNLTIENFYKAAALAKTHEESDLEQKLVQFLERNFEEIVDSPNWQKFSGNNNSFAMKLLTSAYRASRRKFLRK